MALTKELVGEIEGWGSPVDLYQGDRRPSIYPLTKGSVLMSTQDHLGHQEGARQGMSTKSKAGLVLVGFLLIAGALMFTEHRAHVLGLFIWLPLLACPLMNVFMHGCGYHDLRRLGRTARI